MQTLTVPLSIMILTFSGCMSTSPSQGPTADAWNNYSTWDKANPSPQTGDPTGYLGNVHEGLLAYREIYVNSTAAPVNSGERPFPYPEGSIIVKESYANQAAHSAKETPELTIMVKLRSGSSPETSDWEYIMGADGVNRGTGTSGLASFCHGCHTAAAATDFTFSTAAFYSQRR